MNLFKFFQRKPKVNIASLGLIEDPRPAAEKARDYKAEEICTFGPFNWTPKDESQWHTYPIFFQDGSSSCVAQSAAKMMGIENVLEEGKFVHFSARDIYTRRMNKPAEGMWFQDAGEIAKKWGSTVEQLMPSQGMCESQMNDASDRTVLTSQIALPGKMKNYLFLPIDMDAIASIVEPRGKGVMLGVAFGPNEWDKPVPTIIPGTVPTSRHAIVATTALIYNGKRAFVIEDSWGKDRGIGGRRILTQDWFDAGRVFVTLYFEDLSNSWQDLGLIIDKPKFTFNTDLSLGQESRDIEMLQECLRYEKLFPGAAISTGLYGAITAKAVYEFQKKYSVGTSVEIEALQGRSVGPKTRAKLNELFGQ